MIVSGACTHAACQPRRSRLPGRPCAAAQAAVGAQDQVVVRCPRAPPGGRAACRRGAGGSCGDPGRPGGRAGRGRPAGGRLATGRRRRAAPRRWRPASGCRSSDVAPLLGVLELRVGLGPRLAGIDPVEVALVARHEAVGEPLVAHVLLRRPALRPEVQRLERRIRAVVGDVVTVLVGDDVGRGDALVLRLLAGDDHQVRARQVAGQHPDVRPRTAVGGHRLGRHDPHPQLPQLRAVGQVRHEGHVALRDRRVGGVGRRDRHAHGLAVRGAQDRRAARRLGRPGAQPSRRLVDDAIDHPRAGRRRQVDERLGAALGRRCGGRQQRRRAGPRGHRAGCGAPLRGKQPSRRTVEGPQGMCRPRAG